MTRDRILMTRWLDQVRAGDHSGAARTRRVLDAWCALRDAAMKWIT